MYVRLCSCGSLWNWCASVFLCLPPSITWSSTLLLCTHSWFQTCLLQRGPWFKLPPGGRNANAAPVKTTAINLVQLLHSSFTFHYSLLHHLENGSYISVARLLQLLLNLCSPSPFQTSDIKILLPLKQLRMRSHYARFPSSVSFLPHSLPPLSLRR